MQTKTNVIVAAAMLAMQSAAMAQNLGMTNPEYTPWANFRAGTSVTMKQTTEVKPAEGSPATSRGTDAAATVTTTTVMEMRREGMTVEIKRTVTQMGQSRETTSTKLVNGTIPKPATAPTGPVVPGITGEVSNLKEGTEVMAVNGKKMETTTREFDLKAPPPRGVGGVATGGPPVESHVKMWNSAEVPGGLVRMESTSKSPQTGETKVTTVLVDFKVAN